MTKETVTTTLPDDISEVLTALATVTVAPDETFAAFHRIARLAEKQNQRNLDEVPHD